MSRLAKLTEKIGSGATPRGGKNAYQGGDYSLIRSQNILDFSFSFDGLAKINDDQANALSNVEIFEGDVLLNITGDSVARCCQVDPKCLPARVNQHVCIIRPKTRELNPEFLKYFLLEPPQKQYLLTLASSGATRNALTKAMVENLEIPDTSIADQKAIAHILGTLDDKIELNRKRNETLEEIARAIFKSWFVDFDPVRAKAEGRRTGLPSEISDLFPDEFVDSEIGEIPKGWGMCELSHLADIIMGQSPPGDTYNDDGEGLPFYQGSTDFGFRFPSLRKYCSQPKRLADADDVLLSVRAPVGDLNRAKENCCIGRGLAAIKSKFDHQSWVYYQCTFLTQKFDTFNSEGTVFGSLNGKDLKGISTINAPESVLEFFENLAKPIDELIRFRCKEIAVLTELRDTLLPKLISGELRIPDAGKFLEATGP